MRPYLSSSGWPRKLLLGRHWLDAVHHAAGSSGSRRHVGRAAERRAVVAAIQAGQSFGTAITAFASTAYDDELKKRGIDVWPLINALLARGG